MGWSRGPVTKCKIWRSLQLAALNACLQDLANLQYQNMPKDQLLQRLTVFAAVLGCMDRGGFKVMLHHLRIAIRCRWEKFYDGDWRRICSEVYVDPQQPVLGEKAEKVKKNLTRCVAHWLIECKHSGPDMDGEQTRPAWSHYKADMLKRAGLVFISRGSGHAQIL